MENLKQYKGKGILKSRFSYFLSKVAPMNKNIPVDLKNGIRFILRARTMDKSILKEVWIRDIYEKHGICVEKGDTVIDIGAQIGVFSIYASHFSETGKVFAFEPFIENFERLQAHKTINKKDNLYIFNQGVSDKEGVQTLYLSPDNNTGGHSLHLKNESTKKIEIQTIRLDDFCRKQNIEHIDYLKLDCEGAEFDIIKSSETVLTRVNKIVMECHPYAGNTVSGMVERLQKLGFTVFREDNHSDSGVEMIYCRR